jgi:hypothetical protein
MFSMLGCGEPEGVEPANEWSQLVDIAVCPIEEDAFAFAGGFLHFVGVGLSAFYLGGEGLDGFLDCFRDCLGFNR